MSEPTHQVGQIVWVIENDLPRSLIVESQEWWSTNKTHPVYYNLIDESRNHIGVPSTGNHHFQDIFATEKEARANL